MTRSACALRAQCTRSQHGRTVQRYEKQAALDVARAQAHSRAAWRDRNNDIHLLTRLTIICSKRARWRRLVRSDPISFPLISIHFQVLNKVIMRPFEKRISRHVVKRDG